MHSPAPIAVFAFNRPDHLQRTLNALAANELAAQSDLIIFSDAARINNPLDAMNVPKVREYIKKITGFKSTRIVEREKNWGLAPSIIDGVTQTIAEYGRVIVLEDDLITSPHFLRYMNDGLDMYANNPKVAALHGYFCAHSVKNAPETFFMRGANCWGWATWQRAWKIFDTASLGLLKKIQDKNAEAVFNHYGNYNYTGMLEDAAAGRVNSWAIRWLASTWLADMYTLYPSRSLVNHDGSDGSGTHCSANSLHDVELSQSAIFVERLEVQENFVMAKAWSSFLCKCSGGKWGLFKQRLNRNFPKIYNLLKEIKNIRKTR